MADETYEGWTNRETWAVALHINNDQGWQESVHEALREADPGVCPDCGAHEDDTDHEGFRDCRECGAAWLPSYVAGEIIRENVEETLEMLRDRAWETGGGHYTVNDCEAVRGDLGSLWRVNWSELGAAFLSDLEG